MELRLNPAYVWGAFNLAPGMPGDCSGKLAAIFLSCGVPVHRTQSRIMAAGGDGWKFPLVEFQDIHVLALVFFTLKPVRKDGHTGIVVAVLSNGNVIMAHASESMGFITAPVDQEEMNYWAKHFTKARQVKNRSLW